jgi:hypothetical protein
MAYQHKWKQAWNQTCGDQEQGRGACNDTKRWKFGAHGEADNNRQTAGDKPPVKPDDTLLYDFLHHTSF